ncbi:MAG: DNA helicase UvrD [Sphingobacteriia bacterium 35-40-5]|nr:MAG: DNA helicase UvrD [Sphingobacteriia bacterium 35-40-5]
MLKEIDLTGEQKKVLFLPPQGPIQIKGVAGSGKTTIALYRAKHLTETQNDLFSTAKVVIFTFNKTLSAYIDAVKRHINTLYNQNGTSKTTSNGLNILVTNFHKWAYKFIGAQRDQVISSGEQLNILKQAIAKAKQQTPDSTILDKPIEFFKEEISWMKGKVFESQQEYIDAVRSGRGTSDRVTKEHKAIIWSVFTTYQDIMKSRDKIDFDDFALLSLNKIVQSPTFQAPFSHIVIDEAQDLNKAQILTISKLVSSDTNSITIIADSAQRIYKSGFTWKEVGINVQGARSVALKKNYRNSLEIAQAAYSLLSHEKDTDDFTEHQTDHIKSGNKPRLIQFSSIKDEMEWLIIGLKKMERKSKSVILHRTNEGVKKCHTALINAGIEAEVISDNVNYFSNTIKLSTMSSIKGLEFDNVFILDLNDDIIPFPPGFVDDNDEFHVSTERRLLYTCMTRAKRNLLMLSSGKPSRYLAEISNQFIEYEDRSSTMLIGKSL